jgi:3-isopropylmalate dehydrogenase
MAKETYVIAVIPGDGTGPELVDQGIKVIESVQKVIPDLKFLFKKLETSSDLYRRTGVVCPPEEFDACREADAIYKGPIGLLDVRYPDGTELNVDIMLRFGLDMYANIRPIKLRPGSSSVLRDRTAGDIDYVVVRENSEGIYASWAGDIAKTKKAQASGVILRDEVAIDNIIITRKGTERIVRYAFDLARKRNGSPVDGKKRVTCVDKANVLKSYAFFRKVFDEVAMEYPDINTDYAYIDAMTQWMVRTPEWFDVVVVENMFGDIITDLGAATVGSVGLGASANIGVNNAMFEPIHGSSPKYAGKSIANPIGQILSGQMMLEWLGERHGDEKARQGAKMIERAVETLLVEGKVLTPDLGGSAKTYEVGDVIAQKIMDMC